MTDEELDKIREWLTWAPSVAETMQSHMQTRSLEYVRALLAEVERLGVREAQLLAIIDGMSKGTVRIMSNRAVDEHGNEYPIIVERQP